MATMSRDEEDEEFKPEPLLWPDVPRICFGPGDDFDRLGLVARVDWVIDRPESLMVMAGGYRDAAIVLYESMVAEHASSQRHSDALLFPLAYLWRHHVELSLKDIIARGKRLHGEDPVFEPHHRLVVLWSDAKPYVEETGDPKAPELANVEHNIIEIERLDPGSFSFRYPMTKDGTAKNLPNSLTHVSVPRLQEAMLAVANFFEGVVSQLMVFQDAVWEQERDSY
jgi:hypothetical protein